MLEKLKDLKDGLIRKLATSFLLRFVDGKKTDIMRCVQAINMIVAALYLIAPYLSMALGKDLTPLLDLLNERWMLALQTAGHFGLEFAIQDKNAKAKQG